MWRHNNIWADSNKHMVHRFLTHADPPTTTFPCERMAHLTFWIKFPEGLYNHYVKMVSKTKIRLGIS